ncbi:MAG: UbiA family prenyltransferase [Phycisphaerae bacterium]|nr:UbiA family prenyltransferase [Phycisphaerae bacterium]
MINTTTERDGSGALPAMTRAGAEQRPTGWFRRVAVFLDLIKFSHSIFALPFALIATFLASRAIGLMWPGWLRLGLIVACMVIARTFAMTFNRLVDRDIDARNPRTENRPSVRGDISPAFMLMVLVISGVLFVLTTGLFYELLGNIYPVILAVPVLAFIAFYSFTKRFTWLCHFFIGASLMLAPLSAWVAIVPPHGPVLGWQVVFLGAGVLFWTAGFDILYALQDQAVDQHENLFSIPARAGAGTALWISRVCHLLTVLALVGFGAGVGGGMPLGMVYWIGFAAVVTLLGIEQSLVKVDDISNINLAFMTINGLVGVVFGILSITAILWS